MTATPRAPSPAVELEVPSGRRVTVAPRSPDDRVGELADALGIDPRRALHVDGRPVGRHETLARAGLVRGSRIEPVADRAAMAGPTTAHTIRVVCEAGPAAGATVLLDPGRHAVGRAVTATVPIADPALEAHHGLLDIGDDGTVQYVQLTGRIPARVDGEPIAGRTWVAPGATLLVGASRLRIGRDDEPGPVPAPTGAVLTPTAGDPWRRTLRRPPRSPALGA